MKVLALIILLGVALVAAQSAGRRNKRGNLGLGVHSEVVAEVGAAAGGHHENYAHALLPPPLPLAPTPVAGVAAIQPAYGLYQDHDHSYGHGHDHYHHHPGHIALGETALSTLTLHKEVKVGVAQPVPVPVVRQVPYPVEVPYKVHVDRPYPVSVPRAFPVHVHRHVPYEVVHEVPVPVEVVEKVPVEVPVYVPRYRPVPVPHYIHKPVPVPRTYPVTILVKEHIHLNKGGWLW